MASDWIDRVLGNQQPQDSSGSWIDRVLSSPQPTSPQPTAFPTQPATTQPDWISRVMGQGATPTVPPEAENLPWWYRAVQFGAGALEPLMLPGDILRSGIYDVFLRKPGDRSELATLFGNIGTYAPWGDTPERVAPGEEFAKRLGLSGTAAGAAGIVLEMAMDPLFILDAVGTGTVRSATRAASKITRAKLGYEVLSKSDMLRAADELEKLGDPATSSLMRYAARAASGDKLRSPSEWVPEPVRNAIGKTILNMLDAIPSPITKEYITEGGQVTQRLSIAESIFKPGYLDAVKEAGTPAGEAARRLWGFGDATNLARNLEDKAVASKLDEAISTANEFKMQAMYIARNVSTAFKEATGKWGDEVPEVYGVWRKAIADFTDNISGNSLISKEVATTGRFPQFEDVLKSSQEQHKMWYRIDIMAKKYGFETKPLYDAAIDISKQSTTLAWQLGYKLSKLDKYYEVVDKVAQKTGHAPGQVGAALWRKAFGYKQWKQDEKLIKEFYNEWESSAGSLASIDPATFLKNVSQGYMRRMLGLELQDPGMLRKLAESVEGGVRWIATPELDAETFVDSVTSIVGEEKANEVAQFLVAFGDGAVSLQQLEHYTGVPMEVLAQAADEAGAKDLSPLILEKVRQAMAEADTGVRPRAGLFGKRLFQERVMTNAEAAKYLPLAGIDERLAALGQSGGRALQGQLTVETIYNELVQSGLLYDRPARISSSTDKFGTKLMRVPENARVFGPLAGKYIPKYAADALIAAVHTGDKGWFAKALDNIRVGWLAGPATIARNIWGGVAMMIQAGITPKEVATHAKRALELVREVQRTGTSTVLGPGHEVLKLFGEGHMSAEVGNTVDRALREVLVNAGRPLSARAKRVEVFTKKLKDLLTGQPLFSVFQDSEDVMRLTTFLAVRDRLTRRGINIKEAGKIAAQFSNNILFDYASQPEMIRVLKKTGLSLFPAFPAFNLARTARLAVTRPNMVVSPARLAQASIYNIPEEQRQNVSKDIYLSWLRHEYPFVIPGAKPNEYYAIPIRNLFPSLTGFNLDAPITEPLTGGVARAVIDATAAWLNGDGVPPFSSRYGKRVFNIYSTGPERVLQTFNFLSESYVPGHIRTVRDLAAQVGKRIRATHPEALFDAIGSTYGRGYAEALARTVGLPVYHRGDPTLVRELQGVSNEFYKAYSQLRREIVKAAAAGDQKRVTELTQQLQRWIERERKNLKKNLGVR